MIMNDDIEKAVDHVQNVVNHLGRMPDSRSTVTDIEQLYRHLKILWQVLLTYQKKLKITVIMKTSRSDNIHSKIIKLMDKDSLAQLGKIFNNIFTRSVNLRLFVSS